MSDKQENLKTLQSRMLAWLQQGDPLIKQAVTGTEKVPAEVRLDIYANAYRYRLIEALQETFPALHTLMGDEDFFGLGSQYLDHYPSNHFSLRYFGHQLHDFLKQNEQWRTQPLLTEMAQFEWLLRAAFDAADTESLTLEALQSINPEQWPELGFRFHPSLQRIDMRFNIPQLWQAIEQQQPPIEFIENDYPLAWLIWRKELRTCYRSLDVDEAWALDSILAGQSFAEICSGVCEWVDEQYAAPRVAGFIQSWIQDNLLCEISV